MSNLSPAAILYDSGGTEKGTATNPVQVTGSTGSAFPISAPVALQVPTYTSGTTQPLSLTTRGLLRVQANWPAPVSDAFGRLRVSNPKTLFDGKPLYGDRTTEFVEALTGAATSALVANAPIKRLSIGTGAGTAVRQTRWYMDYQAGKSQQVLVTFAMSASPGAGIGVHRVGYFDANDGLFLEKNSDVLYMVRRSSTSGSPVDTAVAQSSWNLDKLDGTGPSGLTLDSTKSQILYIDFEWLGVGTARMGFVIDGAIIYAHAFNWANANTNVYMATPSLPVRWEVTKTSTANSTFLDCICTSVATEGGTENSGWDTAIDRGASVLAYTTGDGTNMKPLISIRTKTAYTRMMAYPDFVQAICSTNSTNGFRWALLINPTITGGTGPTWVSAGADSGLEYDISRTGVVTGGIPVASGYGSGGVAAFLQGKLLPLGATVAGVRDEYVLALQQLVGANENFAGAVNFREIY